MDVVAKSSAHTENSHCTRCAHCLKLTGSKKKTMDCLQLSEILWDTAEKRVVYNIKKVFLKNE